MGLDISKLSGVFKKASSKIDLSTLATKKTSLSPAQLESIQTAIKKLNSKKLTSDAFQKVAKSVNNMKLPNLAKFTKKV